MKTITSWLLGGALAASLTWNWKLYDRGDGLAPASSGESCDPASCALELDAAPFDGVALDPAQRAALDDLCTRSCGESDRLERRADELQRELLASLSAETVDRAAAKKLVDEVGELRRRSLASCVEGILGVRSVLSGDQVRVLLERCEHTSCR